jgi:6-phosphogluconolactonase (cycloisomerase 2 family)
LSLSLKPLSAIAVFLGLISLAPQALVSKQAAIAHYVVTNDDNTVANTASFYSIGAGGKLVRKAVVKTGGTGLGGGYFASTRVNLLRDKTQSCVYVSDAGSNDVAAIDEVTLKRVGTFKASSRDSGHLAGIGMAANQRYLYAAFTSSNTIATYKILSGCKLKFLKDVAAAGKNTGTGAAGMAVHGNLLVVAYGDGSIQSFNISHGVPVSNGDEQNSTGFNTNLRPAAVDISQDGHYAIFGDVPVKAIYTAIEVSDVSSGKLKPTTVYGGDGSLGTGMNSSNIELSPDETLIYVSNNQGGTVTAVFFDKATGVVSAGCVSSVLNGFNATWFDSGAVALKNNASGTGGVLYLAESGNGGASSIGIVTVKSTGASCTLTESKSSPTADKASMGLLSIESYPPRSF